MPKGKDAGKNKAKPKASTSRSGGGAKLVGKLGKLGRKALKLAEQPAVTKAAAAALMAAAASLSEGKSSKKASAKALKGEVAGAEASKFADALRAIAIDVARRTLESWEQKPQGRKSKKSA